MRRRRSERAAMLTGAEAACRSCKEYDRPVCNVLKLLHEAGIFYEGRCKRDSETGITMPGVKAT